jgi:MFS family permease
VNIKSNYGYVIVVCSSLILAVAWGAYYSFGVFLKPLLAEFGWTRAMISGAFSLGMVMQGVITLLAGRLTDRFGARPIIIIGGTSVGLGYMMMWFTDSLWQFFVYFGILTSAGMGVYFVALVSSTTRWYQERRGLMVGIVVAGIGLGAIIVPPLATRMADLFGWRLAFVYLGAAVLVSGVLLGALLRRNPIGGKIPCQALRASKSTVPEVGYSFRAAFRTRRIWLNYTLFFCLGFCLFAIMVHIVPHVTDLGFSSAVGASVIAIIGGLSIIGKIGIGYLADRTGSLLGWMVSFFMMALAMFWLLEAHEIWSFSLFAAMFGLAYGGLVSMESLIVAELFGMRSHGSILGSSSAVFTFGAAFGPIMTGFIYDRTASYRIAFVILGVVAIIGIATAIALYALKRRGKISAVYPVQ